MESKPRVAVLIPAHCPPKVIKTTLGTWLEQYDGSYDADVYIGLHKNYHHYNSGMEDIRKMEGSLTLVCVDEINWAEEVGAVRQILRFSKMHALNLLEIMKAAKNKDFTHAFIFDHDLIFKNDFVGWMLRENPKADMVCSLLSDRTIDEKVTSFLGDQFVFAPKPSAWHMMISKKVFDILVDRSDLVLPGYMNGRIYDTLSLAYHYVSRWGMVVKTYAEAEMATYVKHVWSMSMNYGMTHTGIDNYRNKLDWFEREYDERFPNGIDQLLNKLKR